MPKKKPIWYRTGFSTGGRFDWEREARERGYSSVREMLEDLFIERNMTCYEIAEDLGGVSFAGVRSKLKALGIRKGYERHFHRKYEDQFPLVKKCLEEGRSLKDCLELIGYRSRGDRQGGFAEWMRREKGLTNKGCRRYPKWVFEKNTTCSISTKDVVEVKGDTLTVKFGQMEVGHACRVNYRGKEYLVFKPEEDVLELYELE